MMLMSSTSVQMCRLNTQNTNFALLGLIGLISWNFYFHYDIVYHSSLVNMIRTPYCTRVTNTFYRSTFNYNTNPCGITHKEYVDLTLNKAFIYGSCVYSVLISNRMPLHRRD